jgi:hypothetical protein
LRFVPLEILMTEENTMKLIVATALITLAAGHAFAECDFDRPLGSCVARITIDSTSGSKKSYSAEATVSSSALSCSKVVYYLDNTPQTTVIRNGTTEPETFFGTKPISKSSVRIKECTSYASKDQKGTGTKGGKSASTTGITGPKYKGPRAS